MNEEDLMPVEPPPPPRYVDWAVRNEAGDLLRWGNCLPHDVPDGAVVTDGPVPFPALPSPFTKASTS